ncbi:hypothetical protein FB593_11267 [Rhizobium sp. SJZ105]|nr:hypothetical protein FB593_11267 [Rhizobium sp. SJZ105]
MPALLQRMPTSSVRYQELNGKQRGTLTVLDDAEFGAASPVTPKFISPSDPVAQWTGAHKGTEDNHAKTNSLAGKAENAYLELF